MTSQCTTHVHRDAVFAQSLFRKCFLGCGQRHRIFDRKERKDEEPPLFEPACHVSRLSPLLVGGKKKHGSRL